MSEATAVRSGGQIVVEALRANAADTIYCVPGESFLPVLDALHDAPEVRLVLARHEGAASNMAEAYGKLTGRPGICFVTRGPGATHASNGVHTARADSTPMLLFVGQVDSRFLGREAFQEIDYRQMFGGLAKAVAQVDRLDRIPEVVARAFATALSGRPGPVVVVLPEDVLFAAGRCADVPAVRVGEAAPDAASIAELRGRLAAARRPLLIVGGSGWDAAASSALARFVGDNELPVATSFRRQDLFDNRDRHYVGHLGFGLSPALAERVRAADLLLVVGARLGEVASAGYTLVESPEPQQSLIHLLPDAGQLGEVYRPTLPIVAAMPQAAAALAGLAPIPEPPWREWTCQGHAEYRAYSTPPPADREAGGADLARVVCWLDESLPDDAIVTNGAGNYTLWLRRFFHYRRPATQLAPTNGAMGYGLPAAIAAKLRHPERTVVCLAGDGCFMMYAQELATAVQYDAAVIVVVVDNGMLGTIRMHQEREFPGRPIATALRNPDFVALARAFGAQGERVERSADFPAAFGRAMEAGVPALIALRVDPRRMTPDASFAS